MLRLFPGAWPAHGRTRLRRGCGGSIGAPLWLEPDLGLIETATGFGFFHYGPRLWMVGGVEPLGALQDPELREPVVRRRRTKIIPHAFGERPVLKLMYAAVIRAADRWRGIQVGEFEQRQFRAIREELNRAHAQRVAPAVKRAAALAVTKLRK